MVWCILIAFIWKLPSYSFNNEWVPGERPPALSPQYKPGLKILTVWHFNFLRRISPEFSEQRQRHAAAGKEKKKVHIGLENIKPVLQLNRLLPSLLLRFGKHRRDERPGDRMERKGSSKSKAEDMQASEEETLRMRLEQERWVLRQSIGSLKA